MLNHKNISIPTQQRYIIKINRDSSQTLNGILINDKGLEWLEDRKAQPKGRFLWVKRFREYSSKFLNQKTRFDKIHPFRKKFRSEVFEP